MNAQALLTAQDLSLRFGGVHAFRDVSFEIRAGEVLAIIGPNGAGKTSVLNVLTRVFAPTTGRAVLDDGVELTALPRHQVVRHGVARTFQNIELFEGATVRDNLLLGRHRFAHRGGAADQAWRMVRECLGLNSIRDEEEQAIEKVESVIERLGLSPYRHTLVAGLPYGVRKVIELGRALACEPRLLLLDEPASGLNPEETRELAGWIDDIRSDLGVTVLMIEHDMSLVAAAADRVICMNMGSVLTEGTLAQVQSHPEVLAAYLGTAAGPAQEDLQ